MTHTYDTAAVFEAFGLCVIGFLVIVAAHLMSLHFALRTFHDRFKVPDITKLKYHQTVILILSAMTLLFSLHMLTNFAWGLFIYMQGVLTDYRECIFYSLENYTSLGLTRVNVDDTWRMLAPMISLSGVFCLGWSTAVLVSFFGKLYAMKLDD